MNVIVGNPLENKVNPERIVEGIIVINEKNKSVGSIMLREDKKKGLTLGESFSSANKPRVAFHTDNLDALIEYVKENRLSAGSVIEDYKITIEESTTPFFKGQSPKMNPSTTEVVTHNGQAIYRKNVISHKNSENEDILLKNDSVSDGIAKEIENVVLEANKVE